MRFDGPVYVGIRPADLGLSSVFFIETFSLLHDRHGLVVSGVGKDCAAWAFAVTEPEKANGGSLLSVR